MIVYGDRSRTVDVRAELDRLERAWATAGTTAERRDRLRAVFIVLSELLQGVGDEAPEAEPPFLALTMKAAAALRSTFPPSVILGPRSGPENPATQPVRVHRPLLRRSRAAAEEPLRQGEAARRRGWVLGSASRPENDGNGR